MPVPASLDDTLQDLAEASGRRLVVLDARQAVVAYSIHETGEDRERLSQLLARPDQWTPPAGDLVEIQLPGIGDAAVLPLTDHRRRVGFLLTFLGDAAVDARQLERLRSGAVTLGMLLSLRLLYAERDRSRARELLSRVTGSDPVERRAAAGALVEEGHVGAASQYSAVAIGPDPRSIGPSGRTALAVEMTLEFVARSSTATVVGSTLDDGTGILVFPRPVVGERLARILADPRLKGVRAGIGPVVCSLAEADRTFRLARRALRATWLAPEGLALAAPWDETGLDGLLALLPLEEMTPADLPRSVRRVLAAGLSPEVLQTLESYLDCGGDAQRASQQLRVHRSTLYYRLGRIQRVLEADLHDGRLRAELHLGLRAARHLGSEAPAPTRTP